MVCPFSSLLSFWTEEIAGENYRQEKGEKVQENWGDTSNHPHNNRFRLAGINTQTHTNTTNTWMKKSKIKKNKTKKKKNMEGNQSKMELSGMIRWVLVSISLSIIR